MQKVKIPKRVGRQLYRSSPTILTVVASVGVIVTTITAVRATPKAIKLLKEAEEEKGENLTKVEIIRVAGPSYIPSTLLGISTIVCIFGANALNQKKQTSLMSAYGYAESNEPDIFSSDETTQISIVCPDPYFYSAGPDGTNTTIFYGVEPLFEFAFSNESLTESLIEFGEIKNETEQTVYYSGDAEIGVVITIHAIGNVKNITIYNTGTREVMRIDTDKLEQLTGSGMVAGDEIIISTIKGDKSITLLRNGIYTNILNCLDKDSDWFQLSKGDNIFAYVVEEGTTNVQFKIENRTAFEGV